MLFFQEILSPGSVTAMTSLYLVNGIYFASNWKYPFREEHNMMDQDFRVSFVGRMKVTVPCSEEKKRGPQFVEQKIFIAGPFRISLFIEWGVQKIWGKVLAVLW